MRVITALLVLVCLSTSLGCKGAKVQKREMFLQQLVDNQEKYAMLAKSQEVDGERAGEAANWLEFTNTQNVLPNTGRQQTQGYVSLLYRAGAARVWCIYVTKDATFKANMCNSLLIEMPREPEKRKSVLKAFAKIEKEFWGETASQQPDESLKYLLLNMDP